MFINTTTLAYPITFEILCIENPMTSFPTGDFEPPVGYAKVLASAKPTFDTRTQYVCELPPVQTAGTWTQAWEVAEIFATQAERDASIAAAANADLLNIRQAAKAVRAAAVEAITVTTAAGHTYQGDETSQGRMARAIIALGTGLAPSVTWVLADNSVIQATAAELTEALVLAGQAQAAVWVL